jgi:Fe-S-cluster-containing dehydrogenase component
MSDRKPEHGLLIDYEYCTGCHACEVACSQEYGWEAGMAGIKVIEVVEPLPKDKAYLAYIPFPTELCMPCARRTKEGPQPVTKWMVSSVRNWRPVQAVHYRADRSCP